MKRISSAMIILMALISLGYTACSNKHPEQRRLERAPASLSSEDVESRETALIKEYARKIDQIDIEKAQANLPNPQDKDQFQYRLEILRETYDQALFQLEEYESANSLDKASRKEELDLALAKLKSHWDYLTENYQI